MHKFIQRYDNQVHIYPKKLSSFYSLFNLILDVPIVSFLKMFSFSNISSSCIHSFLAFIYIPTVTPHAEYTRPIYRDFEFSHATYFYQRWLRGHQVSREWFRGYGWQFGDAFSRRIRTAVCRSILSFIWRDGFVVEMSNKLTKEKKSSTLLFIVGDRRRIDTRTAATSHLIIINNFQCRYLLINNLM